MPDVLSGFTHSPTIMIAERLADKLAAFLLAPATLRAGLQFRPLAPNTPLRRITNGVPPNDVLVQVAPTDKTLVSPDLDRTAGVTTIVGCVGSFVAAILPWGEKTFLNLSVTPSPIADAGLLLASLALASAVIAGAVLLRRPATARLATLLIVLALAQIAVAIWDSVTILQELSSAGSHHLLLSAIGTGVYVGVAGSATTFGGSVIAWIDRLREEPRK